jgi:hypothetical protein
MKQNKHNLIHNTVFGESAIENDAELKAYEKPVLIAYGDVRDITLGPTVGEGESGCAFFFRSGPGGCP